jgi:hypothetical protein
MSSGVSALLRQKFLQLFSTFFTSQIHLRRRQRERGRSARVGRRLVPRVSNVRHSPTPLRLRPSQSVGRRPGRVSRPRHCPRFDVQTKTGNSFKNANIGKHQQFENLNQNIL